MNGRKFPEDGGNCRVDIAGDGNALTAQELAVLETIRTTPFGTVEVVLHQSRIVQVVKTEKVKLEPDHAFPVFADASLAATRARAWGLGINWYLSSNLKVVFNHTHARFDGGAPGGHDREGEKTFFSRIQVAF